MRSDKGRAYTKVKVRRCASCRLPMDCLSSHKKYCYDCGLKRRKKQQKRFAKKTKHRLKVEKGVCSIKGNNNKTFQNK
jgi:hypothetical protein